jgi:ArsR family transcriptional regulator
MAADKEPAALSMALGHAARVRLSWILARKDARVRGDIVDEPPLALSTFSQHLEVLRDAGLIRGEVGGPRACCCQEPRTLRRLKALVGGI